MGRMEAGRPYLSEIPMRNIQRRTGGTATKRPYFSRDGLLPGCIRPSFFSASPTKGLPHPHQGSHHMHGRAAPAPSEHQLHVVLRQGGAA